MPDPTLSLSEATSSRVELTDGKRVFVCTGKVNANGYVRADVVRVTDAGRGEGWQPGVRVWLTPAHLDALAEVD